MVTPGRWLLGPQGWRGYRAYLSRPHDGDSFWVMCDAGCDARLEPELRLSDVHAPELAVKLPPLFQPGGAEATEFVNDWLARAQAAVPDRRWYLSVAIAMTASYEPTERTTFRRYVARVWRYADWPRPWEGHMPDPRFTLNADVQTWLSGHPEWPTGE
jgi:endonuclease YncB( thermonuclease family)